MPTCVAFDWPSSRPSASTTTPSPRASVSASTSSVTTAIASMPWARRSAPSTSLNMTWTSDRRVPPASVVASRCLAFAKLLMGTMASVLTSPPVGRWRLYRFTVFAWASGSETRREFQGLLRQAGRGGRVGHERVGAERRDRQARGGLVADERVDQAGVGGGHARGRALVAGLLHERLRGAL